MKKIVVIMFLAIFVLSACTSSKTSFSKVDVLSKELQEIVDPNLRLQSINVEKGSYIIFHTSGEVAADFNKKRNNAIIKFTVDNTKDTVVKQHIYYLAYGSDQDFENDVLVVQVDGEAIPFDNVTIY